jgi:hypothetical protein
MVRRSAVESADRRPYAASVCPPSTERRRSIGGSVVCRPSHGHDRDDEAFTVGFRVGRMHAPPSEPPSAGCHPHGHWTVPGGRLLDGHRQVTAWSVSSPSAAAAKAKAAVTVDAGRQRRSPWSLYERGGTILPNSVPPRVEMTAGTVAAVSLRRRRWPWNLAAFG